MIIRINKNVEIVFLHFTFILIFFSRYIEHGGVWRRIWLLFFLLCLVLSKNYRMSVSQEYNAICFFLFTLGGIFLSLLVFGVQGFSKENSRFLLYIVVMTCAISALSFQSRYIDYFFKSFFLQMNIWWIINLLILGFQVSGVPIMIKKDWLTRNPFYEDLCCGLFGYNGTHCIGLFAILISIYNWTYSLGNRHKKKILIYTGISLVIFMIYCTLSDNSFFVILLLLTYCVMYMLETAGNDKLKSIVKYIIIVLLIMLGLMMIQPIREFINGSVLGRLRVAFTINRGKYNFRFFHTIQAIKEGSGLKFGKGVGFNTWNDSAVFGGVHFGNNSLSEIVCSFGLLFYIIFTTFYALCCNDLISNKKKLFDIVILWLYIVIVSIYTDLFSTMVSNFLIVMIFACIGWHKRIQIGNE